jgi:RNA polymerase sigma-70 factor (ECF subfamily)
VQLRQEEEPPDDIGHRLASGSRDALAEAFSRWSPLVHALALRSLGDPQDAEDVTQQVFISAWQGRHTLRPDQGSLAGWLVGITRNRIADVARQRFRMVRNTTAVASATAPDRGVTWDDDVASRVLLTYELAELGDPRATVLRMAFIEDRSREEIAQTLGIPVGTVKSHIRRGLLHLRSRLAEVDHVTS